MTAVRTVQRRASANRWACAQRRAAAALLVMLGLPLATVAQPGGPRPSPRDGAPIDITGQWVSVVTEDWLWRMVTPPVGDTASVPLNARGREVALAWDLDRDIAEDRLCMAFGPPGLIRQPTRIRIDWADDETLRLRFDAGTQTRVLSFDGDGGERSPVQRSLQGRSIAAWKQMGRQAGLFGGGSNVTGGALFVRTTDMAAGYLRPNGVPYSDAAVLKEYFHTFTLPAGGGTWLIVTSVVDDPTYLTTEFIVSSQFRKEDDEDRWNPRPCEISPPVIEESRYVPGPFG
jgi:hypothetical protein